MRPARGLALALGLLTSACSATTAGDPTGEEEDEDGDGGDPFPDPCADPDAPEVAGELWSDPETWGGALPGPGDDVVIEEGTVVILDQDVEVQSITVRGELRTPADHVLRRAAWLELAETAPAGASEIAVHGEPGWSPGDEIALTPSGTDATEFDEAIIEAVAADGDTTRITLDRELTFEHEVVVWDEADQGHPSGHVTFSPEVIHLSRGLAVTTASFRVEGAGTVYLEDLAVLGAGIDWVDTPEAGVARGVLVRGVSVDKETQGGTGFIIESGANLLWEDAVVYDVTGTVGKQNHLVGFGWSPTNGREEEVDRVFCVRCMAARMSPSGESKVAGYYFSGLGQSDSEHGVGGAVGSVAAGLDRGGPYTGGFIAQESADSGLQYFWGNEAHACYQGMYLDGNHMKVEVEPFVDVQLWRNRTLGVWLGAYSNEFRYHRFLLLGNLDANVEILNSAANWNGFVLDGEGVSQAGMRITSYIAPPKRWAPYARTTFRGNAIDVELARAPSVSSNVFIEFPLSDPPVPTNNFCDGPVGAIQQDQKDMTGEDEMRFEGQTFSFSSCPAAEEARAMVPVPDVASDGGDERAIALAGSRYRYSARRAANQAEADLTDHIEGFEDWTLVAEDKVVTCE